MDFAKEILDRAPLPVRMIKRAVKQSSTMDLLTHLDMISSHMVITRSSQDHAEGINAYLENRKPVFVGK